LDKKYAFSHSSSPDGSDYRVVRTAGKWIPDKSRAFRSLKFSNFQIFKLGN